MRNLLVQVIGASVSSGLSVSCLGSQEYPMQLSTGLRPLMTASEAGHKYQYHVEVYLRYRILQLNSEDGTTILGIIQASTVLTSRTTVL